MTGDILGCHHGRGLWGDVVRVCFWHLVGRGQGCCQLFYSTQTSWQGILQLQISTALKLRSLVIKMVYDITLISHFMTTSSFHSLSSRSLHMGPSNAVDPLCPLGSFQPFWARLATRFLQAEMCWPEAHLLAGTVRQKGEPHRQLCTSASARLPLQRKADAPGSQP